MAVVFLSAFIPFVSFAAHHDGYVILESRTRLEKLTDFFWG
jgi:hypothetical protein